MAGNFIKCPRCELNYIDKTKQTYCDVCLAELKMGPSLKFADLEDDDLSEATELCPVCKVNYIKYNESMCEDCKKEKEFLAGESLEEDESWRDFIEEDAAIVEDDGDISLSQLEEEENEFLDDEDEYDFDDGLDDFDDDFDDDEYDSLDDEDDDDDDDEDDD